MRCCAAITVGALAGVVLAAVIMWTAIELLDGRTEFSW
jgi:hypothetical protein